MKTTRFVGFLLLLQSLNINGQNYFSRYYDFEGDNDIAWNIAQMGERLVVFSANFCHNNKVSCTGLLCFDKNFNLLWKMQLDSVSPLYEESMTTDDRFIYVCVTPDYEPNFVMRLYKIDLNGNVVQMTELGPFNKRISPTVINHHQGILYLNVLYWHDKNTRGIDSTEVWYMDKNFNIIYKFTDTENNFYEDLTGYLPTKDGNFISSKTYYNPNKAIRGLVKKFDPNGKNIQNFYLPWTHQGKYGLGLEPIKPTRDNGYVGLWHQEIEVLFNDTFPMQPMVYKMDSLGTLQWHHIFYSKHPKRIKNLIEVKNGDIILIGDSENAGKAFPYKCGGWVVRLSPNGQILWEKSYNDTMTSNGYSHFYDGMELENEDLVFCGLLRPKTGSSVFIDGDDWIVRTDKNGCILPGCDSFQLLTKLDELNVNVSTIVEFTNPVTNECTIQSDIKLCDATITISDLNTFKIFERKEITFPLTFDLSFLNKGIYFMTIQASNPNLNKTYKFLKL